MNYQKQIQTPRTLLTITVGFLIIYLATQQKWVLTVAVVIGLAGVLSDYLSEKIEWLWMKLTWILSLIVPNILLSLVFYIFLFPIALMAKLFSNKNMLQLRNNTDSTFIESNKSFEAKDFNNPW